MTDTPKHVQELQLKLWLSKKPGERLYQFLVDNDILHQGLMEAKKKLNIPLDELDLQKKYPSKK